MRYATAIEMKENIKTLQEVLSGLQKAGIIDSYDWEPCRKFVMFPICATEGITSILKIGDKEVSVAINYATNFYIETLYNGNVERWNEKMKLALYFSYIASC